MREWAGHRGDSSQADQASSDGDFPLLSKGHHGFCLGRLLRRKQDSPFHAGPSCQHQEDSVR